MSIRSLIRISRILLWVAFIAACQRPLTALPPTRTAAGSPPVSAPTPTQTPEFTPQAPVFTNTPAAVSPEKSATPRAPIASATVSPAASAESSLPDFGPLSASGPYLAYIMETASSQALVLLDADASGRQVIPLPAGGFVTGIEGALSPDGRWLAFYRGTAQEPPYDLTLNILDVRQGSWQTITPLLGSNYPKNFTELAQTLMQENPDRYPPAYYSVEEVASDLKELFLAGIYSQGWSPDSQSLAFAAQLEGISSDIYRLDMADPLRLVRLTSGNTQVIGLSWSANGRWIVHGATNYALGQGWAPDLYVVSRDGVAMKLNEVRHFGGWIKPDYFVHYAAQNGIGSYDVRIVEIDSLVTYFSRSGSYEGLALDPAANQLAMYCSNPLLIPEVAEGLCLYGRQGQITLVPSDFYPLEITFLGAEPARYLIWSLNDPVHWMNGQGELGVFTLKPGRVAVSPDHQWVLHYQIETTWPSKRIPLPRLLLFDAQGQEQGLLAKIFPVSFFWRPDSQGVFLLDQDGQLFYSVLSTFSTTLVGQKVDQRQYHNLWGPEQPEAVWVYP